MLPLIVPALQTSWITPVLTTVFSSAVWGFIAVAAIAFALDIEREPRGAVSERSEVATATYE